MAKKPMRIGGSDSGRPLPVTQPVCHVGQMASALRIFQEMRKTQVPVCNHLMFKCWQLTRKHSVGYKTMSVDRAQPGGPRQGPLIC